MAFSEKRFTDIYKENRYSYSAEIRKEIKEVFNKDISSETLRLHFKKWKEKYIEVESFKEEENACPSDRRAVISNNGKGRDGLSSEEQLLQTSS